MNRCIHMCKRHRGGDGQWYVSCSALDCDKPSEECNEDCCEYEDREDDE